MTTTDTDERDARRALARRPGRPRAVSGRFRAWIVVGAVVAAIAVWGAPAVAALQPAQPPLDEFLPIDELPEEDRLPAAPFLIAAYSIVWILAFGYFWSLARRFAAVESDLAGLARRVRDRDDAEQP
jgi:CcmD family protein